MDARKGSATGGAVVRREARTYERWDRSTSWLRDVGAVRFGLGMVDPEEASIRLARHDAEVRAELAGIERRQAAALGGFTDELVDGPGRSVQIDYRSPGHHEVRTLTRVDGSGGDFVPPIWVMEEWVSANRAALVTGNVVRVLPLPAGTDSINVPRVATGTSTAAQTADNAAASSTDLTGATVTAPVRTIAGSQDISQQMFDQMPNPLGLDQGVVGDLVESYAATLDAQLLNGSGASGQVRGILQVAGIGNQAFVNASPTVPLLWPKLAGAANIVSGARLRSATDVIMHPRRWWWMCAAVDTAGRPLIDGEMIDADDLPTDAPVPEGLAGVLPVGNVWIDPNVPTTNGGGTEDIVTVVRGRDLILWVAPPRLRVMPDIGSGTLTLKVQVVTYVAFMPERRPASIATVTGTGLAAAAVVF